MADLKLKEIETLRLRETCDKEGVCEPDALCQSLGLKNLHQARKREDEGNLRGR